MRHSLLPIAFVLASMLYLTACGDRTTEVKTYYATQDSSAEQVLKAEYRFLGEDSSRIDGEYKRYYDNGKLAQVVVYKDGTPQSVAKTLDFKGEGLDGGTLKAGNGTIKRYNAQGKLLSVHTYKNGLLHGETAFYDGFKSEEPIRTVDYAAGVPTEVNMTGAEASVSDEDFMAQLDSLMTSGAQNAPSPGGGAPPFNPAIADKMMALYKAGKFDLLYRQLSSMSKQLYTPATWDEYLSLTRKMYGTLTNFRRVDMQSGRDPQLGFAVQLMYEAQFKYTQGGIMLSMVAGNGGYQLLDISFQVQPYAPIMEITRYGDPIMEKVKAEDWGSIYEFSSARFKQQTPKSKFKELGNEFKQFGKVTDYSLYTHQVGVMEGKLMLVAIYELTVGGRQSAMQLLFTKFGDEFKLESINASDPNEMEKMKQMMEQQGAGGGGGMPGGVPGGMPGGAQ